MTNSILSNVRDVAARVFSRTARPIVFGDDPSFKREQEARWQREQAFRLTYQGSDVGEALTRFEIALKFGPNPPRYLGGPERLNPTLFKGPALAA